MFVPLYILAAIAIVIAVSVTLCFLENQYSTKADSELKELKNQIDKNESTIRSLESDAKQHQLNFQGVADKLNRKICDLQTDNESMLGSVVLESELRDQIVHKDTEIKRLQREYSKIQSRLFQVYDNQVEALNESLLQQQFGVEVVDEPLLQKQFNTIHN